MIFDSSDKGLSAYQRKFQSYSFWKQSIGLLYLFHRLFIGWKRAAVFFKKERR